MKTCWKLVFLLILFVSLMLKINDSPIYKMNKIINQLKSISISKKDERPLLLFHIGPHKTGTSAIQCSLTHFGSLLHSKESFTFLGRSYLSECQNKKKPLKITKKELNTRVLIDCLNNHTQNPCEKTNEWKKFENLLNPQYSNITNIVISDEAFARVDYTPENLVLLHSLLTKNHRTRIVVGYRDYSEWVLSRFNEVIKNKYVYDDVFQNHKQKFFTKIIKIILNRGEGLDSQKKYHHYFGRALAANIHPTDWLKRLFESYFDDVVVFNIHTQNKNSELATSFLRSVVPASHTISNATLSKIDKWAPQKPNKSINIGYLILAEAAYEKGMIKNTNITLKALTAYIKERCEKQDANYLMICITKEEQDSLFQLSLSYKRKLFSDILQGNKDNYQVELLPAVDEKFCDIDTEKTLADKGWNKFFKSF